MRKLVEYFAQKSLIVNIISAGLLISGILFILTANREAFPKVEYDWVIATTIYPGSTAEDVEKHISIPLENEIRGVEGVDEVYSGSYEARSVLALKLDPDINNKFQVINDIKDAIDSVTDLPGDALDPVVTELSTSLVPVIEISIVKKDGIRNDKDELELRRMAKMLEDSLLNLPGAARIDKSGYREREMIVEVDPLKLRTFYVSITDIINSLSRKNLNFPGGVAKTEKEDIMIRTIGEVETADDIKNVFIKANDLGNFVTIGDVARVRDTFEEDDIIIKTSGMKAITLTVLKKESADIINIVDDVKKIVGDAQERYGDGFDFILSNDLSYYVKRRLNVLINNGIVGFTLVLISLFLTLGWRIATVTAIGLPIAFCMTFIWMAQAGVTINLMSMFGLIIVLGMLVDDAIVVAENIYRHLEQGDSLQDAVVNGTSEVILPVAGTILTTIAAFSPLMFMSGIMGKFIWTLPAVVSVALAASWFESMFILPSHINDIEKLNKNSKHKKLEEGGIHTFFKEKYTAILRTILVNRYKSLLVATLFFAGTLLFAYNHVKFVLFPADKIERFLIKLEAPTGTSLEKMNIKLSLIEKLVSELPEEELDNYISMAGIIREQPMDPGEKRGSNYGTIIVNLTPEEKRERLALDIVDDIREKASQYEKEFVKIEMNTVRGGPPVGTAVSVIIRGDNFVDLKKVSSMYQDYLNTITGVKDVKDDFEEGKSEIRVIVNEKTAAITGISVFDVASTVRSYFEGTVATTIRKSDEEIDIRVKFPDHLRNNLESFKYITIPNRMGNLIPLNRVAEFESGKGVSVINRHNWKRAITVTADIDEHVKGVSSVSVNLMLGEKFADISSLYPGITIDYLGEFKDTKDSMENIIRSFIIAVIVIYFILVALFSSLLHPFVIITVIPMTLMGVIWTFYFHGIPFSFLGLMGVVGLAGVVVNDSIVFVDFIKKNRTKGMNPLEASVDAGGKRLRAVFLTTITTFLGLIPTAYGWGGFDPFLKPMAVAMSWGLLFGTMITLLGTPLVYNLLSDLRRFTLGREKDGAEFLPPVISPDPEFTRSVKDELHHCLDEELEDILNKKIEPALSRRIDSIIEKKMKEKKTKK